MSNRRIQSKEYHGNRNVTTTFGTATGPGGSERHDSGGHEARDEARTGAFRKWPFSASGKKELSLPPNRNKHSFPGNHNKGLVQKNWHDGV